MEAVVMGPKLRASRWGADLLGSGLPPTTQEAITPNGAVGRDHCRSKLGALDLSAAPWEAVIVRTAQGEIASMSMYSESVWKSARRA